MSDSTYGFKVHPELKGKVAKMIEVSGLTSKDWFEGLVSLYELQQTKEHEGINKFLSEISALGDHTSRINEIFSSLLKKVVDEQKMNQKYIEDLRKDSDIKINELSDYTRELEIENNRLSNQLNGSNVEIITYVRQIKQLEELSTTQKMVIDEQQKEIQRLNRQIQEYGNGNSIQLEEELRTLRNELEMLKMCHANELLQLQSNHKQELIDLFPKKSRRTKQNTSDDKEVKKRGRPPKITIVEEEPINTEEDTAQHDIKAVDVNDNV